MEAALPLTGQTVAALAFAGDLSMGQPPEHSLVVSILAKRVAILSGASVAVQREAALLGLIRWAGCTGNARDFADLLGDDIRGRAELLAGRNPFVAIEPPAGSIHDALEPLALAHCEIAALLCARLNLPRGVADAVWDIFENWDGTGVPAGKSGEEIAEAAQYVALASDAEVYTRSYGVTRAAVLIDGRGGRTHEPALARAVARAVPSWTEEIASASLLSEAFAGVGLESLGATGRTAAITLLTDFVDLKVPGHAGRSRAILRLTEAVAREAGLPPASADRISAAAALAALGQVAIPNPAFGRHWSEVEVMRLIPHWTRRILSRVPALEPEAALAALAYERLDGSGLGQGLTAPALGREARLVQALRAAVDAPGAFLAGVWTPRHAASALRAEADGMRLDPGAVSVVLSTLGVRRAVGAEAPNLDLTVREAEVLAKLTSGLSNKEIARALDLSPKTVGTHLERVFRKLGVQTRAAAILKALELGIV